MNEFENKLIIKEEAYKNGLFPKVPKYDKKYIAVILTGGVNDDILAGETASFTARKNSAFSR